MKTINDVIAFIVISLYAIIGIATLAHYGVNWDETAHATRGQAYLYYFLTGKKHYSESLFAGNSRHSFYQMEPLDLGYQMRRDGDHPVFSDIAASGFNFIFYQRLGLLGDFEAYHLYGVVLVTIFLLFLYWWVGKYYGKFAGLVAIISLVLYPLFYGESHYNVEKDIPEAIFLTLAGLCFYEAWVRKSAKWMIATGVCAGAALGTKLNIIFLFIPIVLWLFLLSIKRSFRHFLESNKRFRLAFLLVPLIAFGIFYISWPWLWQNPVKNIASSLGYYRRMGITSESVMPSQYYIWGLNTYAMQWILYTTPLITLLLTAFGILMAVRFGIKEKNKTSIYILLLFFTPIARVMLPHASIYGGVRQIMEYIPPMAILAGIGAQALVAWLISYLVNWQKLLEKNKDILTIALGLITVLFFLPITFKLISLHPNESVYFNPLIGGLQGAKQRNIPGWGNSLGSAYRQGVRWINAHAGPKAKVAMAFELTSSIPRSDFRPDIKYTNLVRSGPKREGEYLIGITHQSDSARYLNYRYAQNFLVPLYEVIVDDVPLLKVWKNDVAHTKPEILRDAHALSGIVINNIGDKIILEFPDVVKLMKLAIFFDEREDCTLPEGGQLFMSLDGQGWAQSVAGNLLESSSYAWFHHHSEKGVLRYLFAADAVRYLKLTGIEESTCLHKYPIHIEAEGI